ncbi:MAG: ACP S-malonyltransferase [Chloroflexia bacterium]|nr:ACP S-malonyltransferase [Chloroflexia bacterium]
MTILADHNIEGQALLLWGTLGAAGWLELVPLRLVRFVEVGLPYTSTDRVVWLFVQTHEMYLLTDNRNMEGHDSLEQTIRDENTERSLPVLTIGRVDRMTERTYREACAARLLDIILYPEDHVGTGRLFIP